MLSAGDPGPRGGTIPAHHSRASLPAGVLRSTPRSCAARLWFRPTTSKTWGIWRRSTSSRGNQVDGLTGGEGGTRAAPGTDGLRQILCTYVLVQGRSSL